MFETACVLRARWSLKKNKKNTLNELKLIKTTIKGDIEVSTGTGMVIRKSFLSNDT